MSSGLSLKGSFLSLFVFRSVRHTSEGLITTRECHQSRIWLYRGSQRFNLGVLSIMRVVHFLLRYITMVTYAADQICSGVDERWTGTKSHYTLSSPGKKSQCPEDSSYIGLQRFFQIFFFIIFTPLMSINQKYEFLEATLFYIWLINCFVLFFPAVNCKQFPNILLSIYASPAGCLCVFVLVALKFTRFKLCFLHAL